MFVSGAWAAAAGGTYDLAHVGNLGRLFWGCGFEREGDSASGGVSREDGVVVRRRGVCWRCAWARQAGRRLECFGGSSQPQLLPWPARGPARPCATLAALAGKSPPPTFTSMCRKLEAALGRSTSARDLAVPAHNGLPQTLVGAVCVRPAFAATPAHARAPRGPPLCLLETPAAEASTAREA